MDKFAPMISMEHPPMDVDIFHVGNMFRNVHGWGKAPLTWGKGFHQPCPSLGQWWATIEFVARGSVTFFKGWGWGGLQSLKGLVLGVQRVWNRRREWWNWVEHDGIRSKPFDRVSLYIYISNISNICSYPRNFKPCPPKIHINGMPQAQWPQHDMQLV